MLDFFAFDAMPTLCPDGFRPQTRAPIAGWRVSPQRCTALPRQLTGAANGQPRWPSGR